jgi:hypothetical protein
VIATGAAGGHASSISADWSVASLGLVPAITARTISVPRSGVGSANEVSDRFVEVVVGPSLVAHADAFAGVGDGELATDRDGDGLFEDGDGRLTVVDVAVLLDAFDTAAGEGAGPTPTATVRSTSSTSRNSWRRRSAIERELRRRTVDLAPGAGRAGRPLQG